MVIFAEISKKSSNIKGFQVCRWCYYTNESRCDIKIMNRQNLKEYNPMMFHDLVLTGQLWTYLADLDEQAKNRLQFIIGRKRL